MSFFLMVNLGFAAGPQLVVDLPLPYEQESWGNNQTRRDATCPITAGALHTGGGGIIFKLVRTKVIKPLAPQFPLAEPALLNANFGNDIRL